MKTAVVKVNLADIRAEPSHQSTRVNQALWGERLDIVKSKDGWGEVVQDDGYRGWINLSYVAPISAGPGPENGYRAVVTSSQAPIEVARKQTADSPYFLYYGTRLRVVRKGGERWTVDRGDGARFVVNKRHIAPIIPKEAPTGERIARQARRFVGVPYLWGGITPAGFDCSGLVRAIFRVAGIDGGYPRDTIDQKKVGDELPRERIKTGDLLFFPGHVVIALPGGRILHSSRSAGGVRIQSMRPDGPEYREDLDNSFEIARRVV